jgi:hypothetical protein
MWQVIPSHDVSRAIGRLPKIVQERAFTLMKEIEVMGPVRGDWPNYGKLSESEHHCHIKKGRPTYVMVWQTIDSENVEITYVGTHERAPY